MRKTDLYLLEYSLMPATQDSLQSNVKTNVEPLAYPIVGTGKVPISGGIS